MKTVFDKATRDELINRISSLNENSKAQWGKMNIYQMLRHCTLCEEMYLGKKTYKRALRGRLFGRIGLRNLMKDDSPLKPNLPTSTDFIIQEKKRGCIGRKNEVDRFDARVCTTFRERLYTLVFREDDKRTSGIFCLQTYRSSSSAIQ